MAFSPDGQRIVTGSFDQTAKVWEAASGRELFPLKGHTGLVLCVTFSPDGRWFVFLSYESNTVGHPANKDVALRLMSLEDRSVRTLVHLVGGGGTINVPSWAQDSTQLAFVSYELLPKETAGNK